MKALKDATAGTIDNSSAEQLVFRSEAGGFSIPYARVVSFRYRKETKFRLGVVATIVVGLVKARAKRHLMTITWKGEQDVPEVVTLDTQRDTATGLLELLRARAAQACIAPGSGAIMRNCGDETYGQ